MTDELLVHLNRDELHELEVPTSFEATGPFAVRLVNHGKAVHVHLHLDDELSRVASLDAGNHYVEGNDQRSVLIDIDPDRIDGDELLGKLKVASAYGAKTRWIDIEVSEPEDDGDGVEVDESLAQPQHREQQPSLLDHPEIPVLIVGAIALLVAALTAVLLDDMRILGGSLVVLGGVVLALFFLLQERSFGSGGRR